MFGYVTINPAELGERSQKRYQAYYCGMCRTLMHRYGNLGRITLSNDMTFLMVLLSSLYEPEESLSKGRCIPHPVREREYLVNELSDYCADMNIALAYHKCRDDWNDEHSLAARVLVQEHQVYPAAVAWFCQGRLRLEQGRVLLADNPMAAASALISPPARS